MMRWGQIRQSGIGIRTVLFILLLMGSNVPASLAATDYKLSSPNGRIQLRLHVRNTLSYDLSVDGVKILEASPIRFALAGKGKLTRSPKVQKVSPRSVRRIIDNPSKVSSSQIGDYFEELTIWLASGYGIILRAYDDGIAARVTLLADSPDRVTLEQFGFRSAGFDRLFAATQACAPTDEADCFHSPYESLYEEQIFPLVKKDHVIQMPAILTHRSGLKFAILESDVGEYAGSWLKKSDEWTLSSVSPGMPKTVKGKTEWGFTLPLVTKRENFISEVKPGETLFPWRAIQIFREDREMLSSDLVEKLANDGRAVPNHVFTPGFATDEWIIDAKPGVDPDKVGFVPGYNTATYKYYVDFASENGLKYIMVDAGWSDPADFSRLNPDINLAEIISHGRAKNVGIILWTMQIPLAADLEKNLDQFKSLGVVGMMADFMNRDDAQMNGFVKRLAEEAGKRGLFILLHGTPKPTGLHQRYPALATYEAGRGHEYNKMTDSVSPEHKVNLAFLRMMAGPFDWEGAPMRTSQPEKFSIIGSNPMGQGTMASQIAPYVFYSSPIQILAGDPEEYRKHPRLMEFFSTMPTLWDETRGLQGEMRKYAVIARRQGDRWYLAGLNTESARTVAFELPIGKGKYDVWQMTDTPDSDLDGMSYEVRRFSVEGPSPKLSLRMARNGGFVLRVERSAN